MKQNIVVFLMQPAGVDFILPIYEKKDILEANLIVTTLSPVIEKLLEENGIRQYKFKDLESVLKFIRKGNSTAVAVDAVPRQCNYEVIKTAKESNITTIGLLDFFGGYRKRFAVEPDYIIVPNEYIRQEMIQEGFAEEKLLPYGNPFFEKMKIYKPTFREEFRKYFEDGKKTILFASQSFNEDGYGITQEEIFKRYVLKDNSSGINIIVKPHPREDPSWLSKYPVKIFNEGKNSFIFDFINYCDLVVGVNSTLLYICYIKGIPFKTIDVEGMLKIDFSNSLIAPYPNSVKQISKFFNLINDRSLTAN